jgi:hypothetical protein
LVICAYQGADKGAMGWAIVDWKKNNRKLKEHIKDEQVQSNYILGLLNVLKAKKCWEPLYYNYIHDDDPKYDLDQLPTEL